MSKKFFIGFFVVFIVPIIIFLTFKITSFKGTLSGVEHASSVSELAQMQFSYEDILANDEFVAGMQKAVKENDQELAKDLQIKVLEIAKAAKLPDAEIQILAGERGLQYMQFLAKRQLFVEAFERRYFSLKGIHDLKLIYPEAQDLFAHSDKLIEQRDQNILSIAQQMASNGNITEYLSQAKSQWQSLHKTEQL